MVGAQLGGQGELLLGDVDPITSAPTSRAYCTARWPRPPTPKIATRSLGTIPATLIALYVVTPAQVSGAASKEDTASGTSTT